MLSHVLDLEYFPLNEYCLYDIILNGVVPLEIYKGVMPMQYVTWSDLLQFALLIVAVIGLVYRIVRKNKK